MRSAHILQSIAAIMTTIGLSAGVANAAELYFAGTAGFSNGSGEGSGTNDLLSQSFSGDDDDASPIFGGSLGIAVPLSDVIPWALRIPSFDIPIWPGRSLHVTGTESFHFPGWRTLIEAEAISGREFEFLTPGASPLARYVAEVDSTSFLANVRLDIPIETPLNLLFGRLPMLEPVTLYAGGGVGVGWNEFEATESGNSGKDDSFDLAYQFGAGLGYAMSDQLHLTLGWRFLDLGEIKVDLDDEDLQQGSYSADVSAHEFTTSIRFHFYSVPFFGRE